MRRRGEKFILAKQHKRVILSYTVYRSHGVSWTTHKKERPAAGYRRAFFCGWFGRINCLPHERLSATTSAVEGSAPQDTSQNTDQERYDKVIEHHETPSLPCRIGLVRAVAASVYHKTHEKIPLRLVNAVGFFVYSFIRARSRRLSPYARPRPPHLHVRQSVRRCGHHSPRRRRSPPPRRVPPAPCGR